MRASILGLILLCTGSAAAADPICAARPGKSTPVCTVPAGQWQLETGLFDWARDKEDGKRDTSIAIGETTVKYGLADHSDIELDVTPWQRSTSRGRGTHDSASGFGDLTVAYKQRVTPGNAAVQVAALPFVKIPTAKRSLGNGKWEAGLLVPVSFGVGNSPFTIGLTPEVDWVADGDGRGHHATMVQVASIGWQVTDKLNVSADLWGQWDWDPAGTGKQSSADGSIAYLLSDSVQIDGGANFGLNRQTPDVEVYTGISARF